MVLGTALAVLGWLIPFLMVLRVVQPTFALAFASYAALLAGTLVGIVGALEYRRVRDRGSGTGDEEHDA